MVAFRVLSTLSSIRVLGLGKTGNEQGHSQDRNEFVNLHKSPLSWLEVLLFKREFLPRSFTPDALTIYWGEKSLLLLPPVPRKKNP